MTKTVRLTNKQKSFCVQDHETILEAAIRAGVSLNYGCSSGTCGLCMARLIEGQVTEIRAHEFGMSEADKLQGNILTCTNTPSKDCEIEAVSSDDPSEIPVQTIEVKVRKVEQLSREVHRLTVQTPRTKRLRFLAGQYVECEIEGVGRCQLSIASCPCEDRLIEFHMRVGPNDVVANAVVNTMRKGDSMLLNGPYGGFVFQEKASRPIIMFAFDIGFAAIKSLLEHLTAQEQEFDIMLIWMACSDGGLYLHNLCRSWTDALDGFEFTGIILQQSPQVLAQHPQMSCQIVEKHLTEALREHEDLSGHDIYVCAPAPAQMLFEDICQQKNYNPQRLFAESVRGNQDLSCMVVDEEMVQK
jgi:CDP-4-dehydro-6-deoxyglucose reductase